ncbi:MAG: CinA family nicotinamide mononucleotide deamidase-related protein [FCB group bacterium]|nr:CinA family nicotinamide mononucleotide deamidase-related protein [FCB group bacterium]
MQAELLMIGTELLIGQIVDTNAAYMAQNLAENGVNLYYKTTVGDNRERILQAFEIALGRTDVVITSGGLGPTEDDLTRDCVAEFFGRPLEYREDLFQELQARFARFKRPMTENNKKQALAPRGAIAIPNPNGTAPGLVVDDPKGTIICLPGVPFELKPMMMDFVIPYLRERFGIAGTLRARVLKVCGVGESRIDDLIGDLIVNQRNPTVGVLASPEWVRIRIMARADTPEAAERLIEPVDAEVRRRLPGLVMGVDEATLEGEVDALLGARGWKLAVAETTTGGMVAQRLTAARAESFAGGIVEPRMAAAKDPDAAAVELAGRVREQFGAECGLAIVGDAATNSCTACFVAPDGREQWQYAFADVTPLSQTRSSVIALENVRRRLCGRPRGGG